MLHFPTTEAMPPTAGRTEWLTQRREGIGSSDVSAILGLSTYESAYSLWEQKTGRAPLDPPADDRIEELRYWGNRLEPIIREDTARELGVDIIKPPVAYRSIEHPHMLANLDGWVPDLEALFEAKNTDARNAWLWDGQVPDHAELQVHHSAHVVGADRAIIAGFVGGNRLRIHEITINPAVVDIILDAESRFWEHVTSDTPPPVDGHVRTMESLTRAWAHKPGVREIPATDVQDAWARWADADAAEKAAAAAKKQAVAELAAAMDGHDELRTGDRVWARAQRGQLVMSRLAADKPDLVAEYTRPAPVFDLEAFKTDHPDIYGAYQGVSIRPKTPKEN
ncbi:YqaJ viral recombinase family protein [Corynebacterium hansenii]|uniref:YqaJ viral recombinase family protein n=1 Tax=Corynebacterium hansenii TaxID=394964 RepID=A0ABV7ZM99_9CORY|nr:YqaJ viral recombinase family protein [Corynebacterium hansenii]WJY99314.1 YqaJ-like viral recombinase domain protein [Corynebacterium hansenii]